MFNLVQLGGMIDDSGHLVTRGNGAGGNSATFQNFLRPHENSTTHIQRQSILPVVTSTLILYYKSEVGPRCEKK